jgi:acetylornithine deacetylase/succinyl-diaminopimelate desuccinylase-like protein
MMNNTRLNASTAYAHTHTAAFLEQYKDFLRIPSIGADPAYRNDVRRAAEWIVADMQRIGIEHCQIIETEG